MIKIIKHKIADDITKTGLKGDIDQEKLLSKKKCDEIFLNNFIQVKRQKNALNEKLISFEYIMW